MPNSFVLLFTCLHVSGWDTITTGFTAVTNDILGRIYFALWYCIGVLLLMNIITSFFITAFIMKINTMNIDGSSSLTIVKATAAASASGSATAAATTTTLTSQDNSNKKLFSRTNVVSIQQSALDETILEYPDTTSGDDTSTTTNNSFQTIINQASTNKEKKLLRNLSLRYSSAINNERISEVRSLLTSAADTGTSTGTAPTSASNPRNYRKNFIIDAEKVRNLSDEELIIVMNRMMKEKKTNSIHDIREI